MKTILVPTDYSETANNAMNYAIELAKFSKARLVLFHTYHVPVPTTEVPIMVISSEELEKENTERLKKIEKEILQKHTGLEIESIIRSGFAVDEILDVVKEKNIDCVVMGITGMGKLGEVLIGSVTTSVLKKTLAPVLIIPEGLKFKKVKKIVFACNYKEIIHKTVLEKFKKFVNLFDAKVLVLDVLQFSEEPTYEKAIAGIGLEHAFSNVEHTHYFPTATDLVTEINSFVDRHKADMLVMIPHGNKSISNMLHRSNTKKMAFHTHIPLLSLHN